MTERRFEVILGKLPAGEGSLQGDLAGIYGGLGGSVGARGPILANKQDRSREELVRTESARQRATLGSAKLQTTLGGRL